MKKKENLRQLLKFITKILETDGYEWFHDELAVLISKKFASEKDTGIKLSAVTIKEIGSIDKYIEEGIIPIIDYSKINDKKVRLQLERDAVEMGKSRLSNFSASISFEKFCKYAHFQSEELVNYYFHRTTENNVELVKNKIVQHTNITKERIESKASISSLPYYMKLWALSIIVDLNRNHNFTLSNISKVRNLEIHRNSNDQIDFYLKKFINKENYNLIYEALVHLKEKII